MRKPGQVFLVGAGPGDPELLTLKAVRLLGCAQAVVYDRLVSAEVLALAPPLARMVPVGKAPKVHPVPQEQINEILIDLALDGLTVVRLKGGDPLVFGRGSEEVAALNAAGIPVEIAPGITAAQGVAAATGVPLTHRGLANGLRFVTGHCRDDRPLDLDWPGLADPDTTLVVYMGAANIAEIAARLTGQGMPASLPVLAVASATTPRERRLVSRLDRIADEAAAAQFSGPVLFVIGRVVSLYQSCPAEILAMLAARPVQEAAYA
ncbi:uroporphyrinogen-III C-methyltransferase [Pelagibius litoralis]|uniref:uroporphyrinogen-III C-methyltransferase n=1 Tax=Pelagibius litoralis TaxID=374515 RepID=A0A967EYC8_9PROT|nr:uroporphyrinogen-III C-methyltransferase [Pelagibius litoralis]NIA69698.1 uroporphyrinogen-III C-methyltransferase [Pelagibius litoralis]